MQSERYIAYRQKWLANRRLEKLAASPINKRRIVEEEPTGRAQLTREQFNAIREAALAGLTLMASKQPVNSVQFRMLRDAWSALAPVQGYKRFVIEVKQ